MNKFIAFLNPVFITIVINSLLCSFLPADASIKSNIQMPDWKKTDRPDWLLDNSLYKADVFDGMRSDEIVLSNGLISRTFKLAPNAATVAFDNLITGESIIRGVKPETVVQIDGVSYEAGGLKGQPNYAFLTDQWLETLTADPATMQFAGFEIGEPKERFPWKRTRRTAGNVEWPPDGVYLRMDYKMPEVILSRIATENPQPSSLGRELLIHDDFKKLSDDWKVHVSSTHLRSSFDNEGKTGEIYTPANTAVFVERSLPEQTHLVEVTIDVGTDKSATWGPGIALVWPDRTVKFNIRPGGNSYDSVPMLGVWNGQEENPAAGGRQKLDVSKPWTLRLRIQDNLVLCEAKPSDGSWTTYETVQLSQSFTPPAAVRIGKLGKTGGSEDFSGEKGELVRLHILDFAAYSDLNEETLEQLKQQMKERQRITVSVHYELYDGIPLMSKWITVQNDSEKAITLNTFKSEILAAVEYGSAVEDRGVKFTPPNILVETDYAFSGMTSANTSRFSVHWIPDPDYSTQVNYLRQNPCLLEVAPEIGPQQNIQPGETFESFRAFILPYDTTDRERQGLAQRRMYRTIAPWATENPLMMHVRYADWNTVKNAIDQCAEVGFEMVILTFGSGFNIENDSSEYISQMTEYADYAKSKGIEIGGYSLLASRHVGGGNDVVMPEGQRPTFGNSPCLHSKWGHDYFRKLYQFYEKTGFMLLEHDGSYPGDVCTSTEHPGHNGYEDSRWNQWRMITDFYKFCRGNGVYLNVPDYYYLSGSNKCGMGYREVNWSLPRDQQVIHTRQNIYDGTWQKVPSMGWMFVPLTEYHGGGAAATIEPLNEHLDHYEKMIMSNLGAGVQACYRGPRLFDTEETKKMVKKCVDWYKKYRDVLEGDIIHLHRADARDIDYWLNINPDGPVKGLLMVYNPLDTEVKKTINVPLYYTGLSDTAKVRCQEEKTKKYKLKRDYSIDLPVQVSPGWYNWYVIE